MFTLKNSTAQVLSNILLKKVSSAALENGLKLDIKKTVLLHLILMPFHATKNLCLALCRYRLALFTLHGGKFTFFGIINKIYTIQYINTISHYFLTNSSK